MFNFFPFAPALTRTDYGGYPIGYLMNDGEFLCGDCVNDPTNPVHSEGEPDGWRLEGLEVLEGSAEDYDGGILCAHCGYALVEPDASRIPIFGNYVPVEKPDLDGYGGFQR